jgi:hypothetical protein
VTRSVSIVCVDLKSVDKGISVALTFSRIEKFYYLFIYLLFYVYISLFICGLINEIFIALIAQRRMIRRLMNKGFDRT